MSKKTIPDLKAQVAYLKDILIDQNICPGPPYDYECPQGCAGCWDAYLDKNIVQEDKGDVVGWAIKP